MQKNVIAEAARAPPCADDDRAFAADVERAYELIFGTASPPRAARLKLWIQHFGLHCVAIYRFDRYARRLARRRPLTGAPLLAAARVLSYAMALVHHVEIAADVGPGLYIGHASCIFIGPTRIGRNFSVAHNVTIGVGHQRCAAGIPSLGDSVWVGTGAVISGAIRVGDGATIATAAVVSRDVPDGALVAGNPGRVVLKDYDNGSLRGRHEPLDEGVSAPAG